MLDEERQIALDTLAARPRRVARAWACGVLPWVMLAALCVWGDRFIPLDESWVSTGFVALVMISTFTVSAIGVCLGFEVAEDAAFARLALRVGRLEVWKRRPVEDFECEDEAWEMPCHVEIIAATGRIWLEKFDLGEDPAQLDDESAS